MNVIMNIVVIIFSIFGISQIVKEIKSEKDEKIQTILIILAAILLFPIIIFYLDLINIGNIFNISTLVSKEGWLNFIGSYFSSMTATVLSAYIVIIMTNKQIERQSIESYRPRLKMNDARILEKNKYISFYGLFSNNLKGKDVFTGKYRYARLNIGLENIGVGLAQDIEFYSLHNGEECVRVLSIMENQNQKMFSTEEIAVNQKMNFDFELRYTLNEEAVGIEKEDFAIILCAYKDINGNKYEIILGVTIKNEIEDEDGNIKLAIDSYYYQENTDSFKRTIEKYKENYEKIKRLNDV